MTNESGPKPAQYPEIATELSDRKKVDQDMRMEYTGGRSPMNPEVDIGNTARMREIVAEIGWPTVAKVGLEGADAAWVLVQHADRDVAFQKECLALMKELPLREVGARNLAMLEDRVMVAESGTQKYGTQFEQRDGKHIPRTIIEPEGVDERRLEMGLVTLQEEIDGMYEQYGVPKE